MTNSPSTHLLIFKNDSNGYGGEEKKKLGRKANNFGTERYLVKLSKALDSILEISPEVLARTSNWT